MTGRWFRLALVASVALNLFLVGVGGTMLFLKAHARSAAGVQRSPLRAAASSLSQTHRTAFLELLQTEGKVVQADNHQARRWREEAWASLSTDEFKPADAEARLASARSLNMRTRGTVEAAVMQFAAGLPRNERAAFGDSMRRAISRQHMDAAAHSPDTR